MTLYTWLIIGFIAVCVGILIVSAIKLIRRGRK